MNEIVASPFPATADTPVGVPGFVAGVTLLLATDEVLVPTLLIATTVNVYVVPFVRPVIKVLVAFVVVMIPVFDVIAYEVIADPPLLDGDVKLIVAWPLPATAVTLVGASGTVAGVTELLAVEVVLVPTPLTATTVNVYVVPFVRPVTKAVVVLVIAVKPPTFDETTYDVIADPPLLDGDVKLIVACPFPAVANTPVGASGVVAGVTLLLVPEDVLVPNPFTATTVNV